MWQEAPAEMKDAHYQVVNQVIQNGQMPTSWEEALTSLIPKRVGKEKFFEPIRPICLMNIAAKIVTSVWAKRLSNSLRNGRFLKARRRVSSLTNPHSDRFHALSARCRT